MWVSRAESPVLGASPIWSEGRTEWEQSGMVGGRGCCVSTLTAAAAAAAAGGGGGGGGLLSASDFVAVGADGSG